jgi:hypothetical protein
VETVCWSPFVAFDVSLYGFLCFWSLANRKDAYHHGIWSIGEAKVGHHDGIQLFIVARFMRRLLLFFLRPFTPSSVCRGAEGACCCQAGIRSSPAVS